MTRRGWGLLCFPWRQCAPAAQRKISRRAVLEVERLEDRVTPALYSGSSLVDASQAFLPASASSPTGARVVVWTYKYSSTDWDIWGQLYDSSGAKVGGQIPIDTSTNVDYQPTVAMDGYGDFVVAWHRRDSNGDHDIVARRFNSAGVARGASFYVAGKSSWEGDPSIAVNYRGDFVISYTRSYYGDHEIYAKMYYDSGTLIKSITVANSAADELHSAVARSKSGNGNFSIVYQVSGNVALKRYSSAGALLGTYMVASSSNSEIKPSVAIDNNNNTVVAWQEYVAGDWDIHARKVFANGAAGKEITVRASSSDEYNCSLAMDASDGDFVVSYLRNQYVYVTEVSSGGAIKGTYTVGYGGNSYNYWDPYTPSISINGSDGYIVAYEYGFSSDSKDVYARFGKLV